MPACLLLLLLLLLLACCACAPTDRAAYMCGGEMRHRLTRLCPPSQRRNDPRTLVLPLAHVWHDGRVGLSDRQRIRPHQLTLPGLVVWNCWHCCLCCAKQASSKQATRHISEQSKANRRRSRQGWATTARAESPIYQYDSTACPSVRPAVGPATASCDGILTEAFSLFSSHSLFYV